MHDVLITGISYPLNKVNSEAWQQITDTVRFEIPTCICT